MFTEDQLLEALRNCYDPALRLDLVTLGRVRRATLTPDSTAPGATIAGAAPRYIARVEVLTDDPDDEAAAMLSAQISNRLAGVREISRSEVVLLRSPFPILR